jgi:hypothetical protein
MIPYAREAIQCAALPRFDLPAIISTTAFSIGRPPAIATTHIADQRYDCRGGVTLQYRCRNNVSMARNEPTDRGSYASGRDVFPAARIVKGLCYKPQLVRTFEISL